MELRCLSNLMYFQSVPGTGDKDKEEDKGMTIEEKKEAERQRCGRACMYIMDAQVGLKTIALTLFLKIFFHFLPAAALCHDFSWTHGLTQC